MSNSTARKPIRPASDLLWHLEEAWTEAKQREHTIEQQRLVITQLKEAIYWALGERDDWPPEPPPLAGRWRQAFYWRTELRRRSGLPVDGRPAESEEPSL